MKKILKIFRNFLVITGWTFVFLFVSRLLMSLIWSFDFLSYHSWSIFSNFWNTGGVFKSFPDIMLLICLFMLPFLWFFGLRKSLKLNYVRFFLSPFVAINRFLSPNNTVPERIVLKNVKSTQQMIEDIKEEIASIKPAKNEKAGSIRDTINKKISEEVKK